MEKMMRKLLSADLFKSIADIAVTAKGRRDAEHASFLAFYRQLVEVIPTDAVTSFGSVSVNVKTARKSEQWAIELTVTDYMWWKQKIEQLGVRFEKSPASVQADMLVRLSKAAEASRLNSDERKALLGLLDAAA
ncbi:hypothetical protein [Sphingomonas sp. SRS2]|uniref:hypothetical protein n=1 Tax=Sphingomonas sp. SRS2 TaxID=133190 RepID=UPI0006184E5C|nr:hypothetical protein [Sphingomonas sp. SRS2]KKC25798.1 hypothetical protein WP12_12130 [Sphingomonas sp. SRS2]